MQNVSLLIYFDVSDWTSQIMEEDERSAALLMLKQKTPSK